MAVYRYHTVVSMSEPASLSFLGIGLIGEPENPPLWRLNYTPLTAFQPTRGNL